MNRQSCGKCHKPVYAMEKVVFQGGAWHKSCFRCQNPECNKNLSGMIGKEYDHNNLPYCQSCFNKLFRPAGYGFSQTLDSFTPQEKRDRFQPSGDNKARPPHGGPQHSYLNKKESGYASSPVTNVTSNDGGNYCGACGHPRDPSLSFCTQCASPY